jgi:hypothetical protein
MDIDPKRLSEKDREKLLQEVKAMMKEDDEVQPKGESKANQMDVNVSIEKLDERLISPDKIKDIFDKMTVIDTNPSDRSSVKFEQGMQEMERKNTQKRSGIITIKTMRKGRVSRVSDERFETDSTGRIQMMDKRYIRFNEYEFPETAKIEADGIAL